MIQGVINILISDTGIKDAIGLTKKELKYKVSPVVVDVDEKPPFSTCSITGTQPDNCKGVASKMDKVFFDVVTYTEDDYELRDNIDNQIRWALDEYRGVVAGIEFREIRFAGNKDLFDNQRGYYARVSSYWAHVIRKSIS